MSVVQQIEDPRGYIALQYLTGEHAGDYARCIHLDGIICKATCEFLKLRIHDNAYVCKLGPCGELLIGH